MATITLTEPTDRSIIQRDSGNQGAIVISGTYTESPAPVNIEARIVEDGTSTEVKTWTVIDSSPSSGTFSGTLSGISQGGWYNIQVRFSNDINVVDNGINKFGVGILVAIVGQSNAVNWFSYTTSLSLNGKASIYTDAGWGVDDFRTGSIAFANYLYASLGDIPIGLIRFAVNGSALLAINETGIDNNWEITSAGSPSTEFLDGVDAVGGEIEYIIWNQGEEDARNSGIKSTYQTGLGTLFTRFRNNITSARHATLPILVSALGNATSYFNDIDGQNIRSAQKDYIISDDNSYLAAEMVTTTTRDGVHWDDDGYKNNGERMAQTILYLLGDETYYRGPQIRSYEIINSSTFDIKIAYIDSGGTDFTPTTGITGFEILDNGSQETITSATRQSAYIVRLIISDTITGTLLIRYLYGATPTIT
ncbi:MAG: hypothetical protein KAJ19_10375, partial [Gammaproteobacteria bacterium]|nr:hypothetical protein [Gammaproteobacteria bacterium]